MDVSDAIVVGETSRDGGLSRAFFFWFVCFDSLPSSSLLCRALLAADLPAFIVGADRLLCSLPRVPDSDAGDQGVRGAVSREDAGEDAGEGHAPPGGQELVQGQDEAPDAAGVSYQAGAAVEAMSTACWRSGPHLRRYTHRCSDSLRNGPSIECLFNL